MKTDVNGIVELVPIKYLLHVYPAVLYSIIRFIGWNR